VAKNITVNGKSKTAGKENRGLFERGKNEPSCVGTGTCTERVIRFASVRDAALAPEPFGGEASEGSDEAAASRNFPVTHDGFV